MVKTTLVFTGNIISRISASKNAFRSELPLKGLCLFFPTPKLFFKRIPFLFTPKGNSAFKKHNPKTVSPEMKTKIFKIGRAVIICFIAHKGGVGKTTVAMGLGQALITLGKKVLLMDLEENNNLSDVGLNSHPDYPAKLQKKNWYTVLSGAHDLKDVIWTGLAHGFDLIPTVGLTEAANGMFRGDPSLSIRLEQQIHELDYDFIIMDLSPLVNGITEFALSVSDLILAPVEFDTQGLSGIVRLTNHYKKIDPALIKPLRVVRNNITASKEEALKRIVSKVGLTPTEAVIYKSESLLNSKNAKEPFSTKHRSFEAFMELAQEIVREVA
ncbi:ParA family protein [Leptospira gomenensis]|uniref:ParA family protein n=1 Tax=Leptospira gomenensis TaxID=2484974 RepID=UPI001FEFBEBA|nr:ParA family protein [Leptospira gomenensis]